MRQLAIPACLPSPLKTPHCHWGKVFCSVGLTRLPDSCHRRTVLRLDVSSSLLSANSCTCIHSHNHSRQDGIMLGLLWHECLCQPGAESKGERYSILHARRGKHGRILVVVLGHRLSLDWQILSVCTLGHIQHSKHRHRLWLLIEFWALA